MDYCVSLLHYFIPVSKSLASCFRLVLLSKNVGMKIKGELQPSLDTIAAGKGKRFYVQF